MHSTGEGGGIAAGLMLCVVGVLAFVVGVVTFSASQGAARLTNAAETRMPGAVTFQAGAGERYGIALDQRSLDLLGLGDEQREVAATRCTITLASGEVLERRGDRTVGTSDAGGVLRFATFTATAGQTTVDCRYTRNFSSSVQLLVYPISRLVSTVAWALLGGGLLLGLLGGLLIWRGFRSGNAADILAGLAGGSPSPPLGSEGRPRRAANSLSGGLAAGIQAAAAQMAAHGATVQGGHPAVPEPADVSGAPAGLSSPVMGVTFDGYVAAEASLAKDRVRPDQQDIHLSAFGVPPGTWEAVRAGWQARMAEDWRVGAAFGEAYERARKGR